eukprot:scaffold84703_cov28-Tisochrysis_lutea.AAC.5
MLHIACAKGAAGTRCGVLWISPLASHTRRRLRANNSKLRHSSARPTAVTHARWRRRQAEARQRSATRLVELALRKGVARGHCAAHRMIAAR